MALLYQNTFTAANGTKVQSVTPDIGSAMVNDGASDSAVQNNRAYAQAPYSRYRTNQTFSTANYVSRGVARRIASTSDAEVVVIYARTNSGSTTHYRAEASKTDIKLFKSVSGTSTQLGSTYSWSPSVGVDYTIEVVCNGSSISVRLNSSDIIGPVTDTAVTASANAGFAFYGPDSNSTRGWHLDSLEVDDTIPGGVSTVPVISSGYHLYGTNR